MKGARVQRRTGARKYTPALIGVMPKGKAMGFMTSMILIDRKHAVQGPDGAALASMSVPKSSFKNYRVARTTKFGQKAAVRIRSNFEMMMIT